MNPVEKLGDATDGVPTIGPFVSFPLAMADCQRRVNRDFHVTPGPNNRVPTP